MIGSNQNENNDLDACLNLVLSKVREHELDPLKQLDDTEEDEAFEVLVNADFSNVSLDQMGRLLGVYTSILYDFPFAYPEYDGKVSAEKSKALINKYETRVQTLNEQFCKVEGMDLNCDISPKQFIS